MHKRCIFGETALVKQGKDKQRAASIANALPVPDLSRIAFLNNEEAEISFAGKKAFVKSKSELCLGEFTHSTNFSLILSKVP